MAGGKEYFAVLFYCGSFLFKVSAFVVCVCVCVCRDVSMCLLMFVYVKGYVSVRVCVWRPGDIFQLSFLVLSPCVRQMVPASV